MSFLHEIETFCRGFQDQWHALLVNAALKVLAFDIEAALKKTARDTYLPFDLLKTKNQEEIFSKNKDTTILSSDEKESKIKSKL